MTDQRNQLETAKAAPAIAVTGIAKRYGSAFALTDVSFAVEGGSSLALWGPNGAGKTTILRCLLGLAHFTGTISIHGIDPQRSGKESRGKIGFVPQDLPISPLTVSEMTTFVANLKHAPVVEALKKLEVLGIGDQLDKSVGALSGGMKQRLSLALALIGEPSILLLDEPTANLDARGRAELLDLLRNFKRDGMTLVFSSHRPEDVISLADRVLMIERGRALGTLAPSDFQIQLGRAQRLIVTLRNGHMPDALVALKALGIEAESTGRVLSIPVSLRQKADVLSQLARNGVEIDDFEVERREWTEQS